MDYEEELTSQEAMDILQIKIPNPSVEAVLSKIYNLIKENKIVDMEITMRAAEFFNVPRSRIQSMIKPEPKKEEIKPEPKEIKEVKEEIKEVKEEIKEVKEEVCQELPEDIQMIMTSVNGYIMDLDDSLIHEDITPIYNNILAFMTIFKQAVNKKRNPKLAQELTCKLSNWVCDTINSRLKRFKNPTQLIEVLNTIFTPQPVEEPKKVEPKKKEIKKVNPEPLPNNVLEILVGREVTKSDIQVIMELWSIEPFVKVKESKKECSTNSVLNEVKIDGIVKLFMMKPKEENRTYVIIHTITIVTTLNKFLKELQNAIYKNEELLISCGQMLTLKQWFIDKGFTGDYLKSLIPQGLKDSPWNATDRKVHTGIYSGGESHFLIECINILNRITSFDIN